MNNELYFLIIVIEVIILLILLYTYFNKKKVKEHHADHSESANPGIKFYDRHCGIYPVVKRVKQAAVCEDGSLTNDKERCNQPGVYRKQGSGKIIINGDDGIGYEIDIGDTSATASDAEKAKVATWNTANPNALANRTIIDGFLADNISTCAPPNKALLEALGFASTSDIYKDAQKTWSKAGHYIHTLTLSTPLTQNVAAGTEVVLTAGAATGIDMTKIKGTVVTRTLASASATTLVIKQDLGTSDFSTNDGLVDPTVAPDTDGILRFTAIEFPAGSSTTEITFTDELGGVQTATYTTIVKVKSQAAQFWEQQYAALGNTLLSTDNTANLEAYGAGAAFFKVNGITATSGYQNGSKVGSLVGNGSSCKVLGSYKKPEVEALKMGERCGDFEGNPYNGCDPKDYRTNNNGTSVVPNNYFPFGTTGEEVTKDKADALNSGLQESETGKLKTLAGANPGSDNAASEAAGKSGRIVLPNKGKVRASLDSDYKVIARDCIPAGEPGVIIHEHFSNPFNNMYSSVASFGNKFNNLLGLNTIEGFTEHLKSQDGAIVPNAGTPDNNVASITNYIGSRDVTCRDDSINATGAYINNPNNKSAEWLKQHMRMRNNASCTVKENGGPLQYKVEKLVEISANSGFFTITIRLHGDSGRKWEMGHNTVKTGSQTLPPSSTKLAETGFVFNTDYKSDLFLREFKHVIDYSKVELYDSVGYTGGYDFAKAIKKAPSGQVGGGNATGTADKQAYDNFKWTFGEKGRSSRPHIDITTCPIPWNATSEKIVQAISKVWKNFAIDNFGNIRNPPSGVTVDDAQGDNYIKIKQQYMKLNGVIIKPKLAIHIQDVHQAQTQQSATSNSPGTENIYNYTEPLLTLGNDTLSTYATPGNQTANISSKIRWNTAGKKGTDTAETRTGVWELAGTKAECPTRRDYNSNTNKSRRKGTANTPNLAGIVSIKQAETINCIPYNTQEDRSKFVPRRIRIGFIDTGNFTPSYDNLHVLVNTVPKSQLGGYQRQMTLDATNLTKVGDAVSFAGDIKTDATTGKPTTDAYKAFFNASLSTYENDFTLAQSNSNNLNGGIFSYKEDSMININNIANWDTDKILSIGLGDYEDPDKGAGNVYLVQRSKAPDKRENCHSGFGKPTDKFYGQNDQIYPDSCLQSRSYVRNESTSKYDSSQWDSHGRFHLANNDIEQHLRDRHNINIIENPQDQTLVFFVFYKEDDINKDYSYNNVEALKLATYWEKLTKQAKGTKEIYMKVNYLTRLFNEGKTMSIKENKLYQTLVMINNYLSSSYRLTRSSRQLNGKVSNLLRDLSNFARKHSSAHDSTKNWDSTAEGIKIIMRGPSSIQYSNYTGTKIQTLSNPYRDTLNFYSKNLVSSAGNKYNTTTDKLEADLASGTDLYTSYDNIAKQSPLGTAMPKSGDIYFDFNALINFLEKDTTETQDNTFKAANDANRVWGITQGNVSDLTAGAKDGSGYSARDARARPAAWSKDFNICNEELSTSKFAEEMNYRAKLTNVAVAEPGSTNLDTHPDFVSAKDTQYLNATFETESSLQVMTGKYPARVAAWGGVGTVATINSTTGNQMYGRAEGAVVSIIASKFIKSGSGAQVVGKKGGVTLTVGSVTGTTTKAEGLSVALAVDDVITVGTGATAVTGTVDEVVAAGSGSQTINLTIGGIEGNGNLGAAAAKDAYVYQVGTSAGVANTIIASGTLDVAENAVSATSILQVTLLNTSPGSFDATGKPDLRIASTEQTGATFDDTAVGVIKTNNIQPVVGAENAARKNLKLLSSVTAAGTTGTSVIKITLTAGTFTAAGNPTITVTNAAGTAKAITTETGKTLKIIDVGAGSLGGTLSEAVNLYTTEF